MSFLSSCTSGGCGAKIDPGELASCLASLPSFDDQNLLIGFDHSDDSAAYQISNDVAILSTVDFFSPMVNDPRHFGRIAAANALSDIYACGGKVLFALNLVCFPQKMDKSFLAEMLAGGAEKVQEAGAVIAGGHSIYDHEPKYGLAVTGSASPQRILRNNSCRTGDCLILTKALGIGLILSAMRGDLATPNELQGAINSMEQLNKYAAEAMMHYDVSACTDITGFGLLAHAIEMAGNHHTLLIDTQQLPFLPGAYTYASEFLATAAGQRNRLAIEDQIQLSHIDLPLQEILFDPQTSGGLLISVSEKDAANLLKDIQQQDPVATIIGQVIERKSDPLLVL